MTASWLRRELQVDELSQFGRQALRGLGAQDLAAIGGPIATGAAGCAALAVQACCELAQVDAFPRAGPLNQTLLLVGLAAVKDPGNDDGPADGFIRVEHPPIPHTETPRVLQRPLLALDLPDLALCIAINRLRYAHPDRRIESLQVLERTAGLRNSPLQRPNSRFISLFPHKRLASISSYASPRRR